MKIKLKVAAVVDGSVEPVGAELDVADGVGMRLVRQGKAEVVRSEGKGMRTEKKMAVRRDGEKAVQDVASIVGDGGTEGSL